MKLTCRYTMKHFASILLLPVLFLFFSAPLSSDTAGETVKTIELNKNFYQGFYSLAPIEKDDFWKEKLNNIAQGKGVIFSVERMERYKKFFRIVVTDREAARYNLNIKYYIFAEKEESVALLVKDDVFEFRGQIIAYTPVNSTRTEYIIDMIFEKGAVSLE